MNQNQKLINYNGGLLLYTIDGLMSQELKYYEPPELSIIYTENDKIITTPDSQVLIIDEKKGVANPKEVKYLDEKTILAKIMRKPKNINYRISQLSYGEQVKDVLTIKNKNKVKLLKIKNFTILENGYVISKYTGNMPLMYLEDELSKKYREALLEVLI